MQMQSCILIAAISMGINLLYAESANAALLSRLNGQALYDTDLNVTWLADANYAKTSGYDEDGLMTWYQAQNWISSLNAENGGVGHLGYNDWRLPNTGPVNGISMNNYDWRYDGSSDYGANVSAPGSTYAGSKGSEMAYLFYNELGNKSYVSISNESQPGYGLVNKGPFSNFQSDYYISFNGNIGVSGYWSGTEFAAYTSDAWLFYFPNGNQGFWSKNEGKYTMAVRPGDVASVPAPAAIWLLGSGLLGLAGVVRKRKTA